MARYDTTLEAAGAEMLVVGRLLIERLQSYRAYANQPGYDLLVVNDENGRSIKVQVKSRTATDAGGFKIENRNFDFAVLVRLNRGTKRSLSSGSLEDVIDPEFYVLSKQFLVDLNLIGRKFRLSAVSEIERFRDAWGQIRTALSEPNAVFGHPDGL